MSGKVTKYDIKIEIDTESYLSEIGNYMIECLEDSSPKKTGKYSKGWKASKKEGYVIVHNEDKPKLTHLLENGHLAKGKKKRIAPQPHIRPSFKKSLDKFNDYNPKIKIG